MKKIMLVFRDSSRSHKDGSSGERISKYPRSSRQSYVLPVSIAEMLDQVLHIFEIIPDYDLNIMKPGQDLYDVTARVLIGMRDVLKEVQPDVVLFMVIQPLLRLRHWLLFISRFQWDM